jgi:hypothetical protein
VRGVDVIGAGQVSDGASQFQDAVIRAGGELQLLDGGFEQALAGLVQTTEIPDLGGTHIAVEGGAIGLEACRLPGTCLADALADLGRGLTQATVSQFLVFDAGDLEVDVDAVEQWARDALLVAGDGRGRAGALLDRIPGKAAGTPLRCPFAMSP